MDSNGPVKTTMASLSGAFYTKRPQKCQRVDAPPPAVSRDDDNNPPDQRVPDLPLFGEKDNRKNTPPTEEEDLDDDDPFGLKDQAKKWLEKELTAAGDEGSSERYIPSSRDDGTIPPDQWDRAYAEFHRRFVENASSSTGPSVLLVATKVSKNWTPGEELRKAKYLFFPNIDYAGETLSALFIIYMPGPEHGAADAYVNDVIGGWRTGNPLLLEVINRGLSSGSYRNPQPDSRIFPMKKYKNHIGNDDVDRRNGKVPYSRFIWEIEWKNRTPVDIRKNGRVLMRSLYNRLYLAAKIYGVDDDDGKVEAAMVLWGREEGNGDGIRVVRAVSFGTKDLSQENKEDFARNESNGLVGVRVDAWLRPANLPEDYPDTNPTPQGLMLNVPLEGILYKISYKTAAMDEPRYLTELLGENEVTVPQLEIDLRKLLVSVLDVAVPYEET